MSDALILQDEDTAFLHVLAQESVRQEIDAKLSGQPVESAGGQNIYNVEAQNVSAVSQKYDGQYPEANTQVWKEYIKINLEHIMRACFEQSDPERSAAAWQVLEDNRKGYQGMLGKELFEQTIAVYQMMHGRLIER